MAFVDQMKHGITKAIQIASDNTAYSELPECSSLSQTQTLSIKAADPIEIIKASERYLDKGETYMRIKFLIRDEKADKRSVLSAELVSGRGFIVKTLDGTNVMDVRLADRSSRCFGKLLHPSQATIYKIVPSVGSRFFVYHIGETAPTFTVEKVFVSLYPIAKVLGLIQSECVYIFKSSDGKIAAYLRPKIVLNAKTMIVRFMKHFEDHQKKVSIMGIALLLLLHDVYPELREILEAGVHHFRSLNKA
uniref:Doublecortin domain-containing protein n=1 Tax=Syphacia muris TaxID=451379 RepID=A0A0N5AEG2_9BILA